LLPFAERARLIRRRALRVHENGANIMARDSAFLWVSAALTVLLFLLQFVVKEIPLEVIYAGIFICCVVMAVAGVSVYRRSSHVIGTNNVIATPTHIGIGGSGGSGTIIGGSGTIIGGHGGNVGAGGIGRGGDGGSGTIDTRGSGLTLHHAVIIGGEGGSVDGTDVWYPPAQSGFIQAMEARGQTPDFNVQYPGAGGATGGWLERQNVVVKIREQYFREHGEVAKIRSSKIDDVPLEYVNEKLHEAGYPWRARIEKKYWYLFYIP